MALCTCATTSARVWQTRARRWDESGAEPQTSAAPCRCTAPCLEMSIANTPCAVHSAGKRNETADWGYAAATQCTLAAGHESCDRHPIFLDTPCRFDGYIPNGGVCQLLSVCCVLCDKHVGMLWAEVLWTVDKGQRQYR